MSIGENLNLKKFIFLLGLSFPIQSWAWAENPLCADLIALRESHFVPIRGTTEWENLKTISQKNTQHALFWQTRRSKLSKILNASQANHLQANRTNLISSFYAEKNDPYTNPLEWWLAGDEKIIQAGGIRRLLESAQQECQKIEFENSNSLTGSILQWMTESSPNFSVLVWINELSTTLRDRSLPLEISLEQYIAVEKMMPIDFKPIQKYGKYLTSYEEFRRMLWEQCWENMLEFRKILMSTAVKKMEEFSDLNWIKLDSNSFSKKALLAASLQNFLPEYLTEFGAVTVQFKQIRNELDPEVKLLKLSELQKKLLTFKKLNESISKTSAEKIAEAIQSVGKLESENEERF